MSEQTVKPICKQAKEVVALLVGKDKNRLSEDKEYIYLKKIYSDLDDAINEYTTVDVRENAYQGSIKRIVWKS